MRISLEKTKKGFIAIAREGEGGAAGVPEGTRITSGAGETPKEAATWLVKHINQMAVRVEDLVIELGLMTPEEVDEASQPAEGTPS